MKPRDIVDMLLVSAIWGGAFPLLRVATPAFGPVPLVGARLAIAAAVLLAVTGLGPALRSRAGVLLLLGVINTAVPFALFSYATLSITAGMASLLNATTPMFGALVAYFWLGERLTLLRTLGILIGFAGVGTLVWGQIGAHAEGALAGILAGLVGAAMYGLSANFTRRLLLQIDPLTAAAGNVLGAAIVTLPFAALQWPAESPGPGAWAAVATLAIVSTALAYLLYFRLMRTVGVSKAITVTFLIPVFGIVWGAIFLGEPVTPSLVAGCAVVLFGTGLATGFIAPPARARAGTSGGGDGSG